LRGEEEVSRAIHNYEIAPDGSWIRCGQCGRTSNNTIDVGMKYCGYCHTWLSKGCCDFCSGEYETFHDYEAVGKFVGELNDGRVVLDGDLLWAACQDCEQLIESGDWEGLISRGLAGCDAKWGQGNHGIERAKVIWMYRGVFGDRFTVTK